MGSIMNYSHLKKFSFRYDFFVYVDAKDYLADQLFIEREITVAFLQEYAKPDSEYIVIFCKVHKKDRSAFEDAVNALNNKMLLMGHPDYPDFCGQLEFLS